jgi:hypothetical protein
MDGDTRSGHGNGVRSDASWTNPDEVLAAGAWSEGGRWRLDGLRSIAVHMGAAGILESRAAALDNPVLAALLRERAASHRRTADRLRSGVEAPRGDGAAGGSASRTTGTGASTTSRG